MSNGPARPSQVSVRTVLTVCFTILAVAALVEFLLQTRLALLLTLGAAILAVALNHAVEALVRRRVRRGLAMALVVTGGLCAVVSLCLVLIPPAISQANAFVAQAPVLWQKLQQTQLFLKLDQRVDLHTQLQQISEKATGAITPMLSAVGGVVSALGTLLTLIVLTIFVLIFAPELVTAGFALIPDDERDRTERIAAKVYRTVGRYVGGLLGICAINAALTTIFLAIARMPFFLPLAILSGLSSLVPYAGPLVSGTAITLVALVTGGAWKALATGIYFVLYGQLEGNVLGPVIYRRAVDINPLVTTLAILFLAEFMGLPGAIIAVPLAATAQILLHEIVAARADARAARTAGGDPASASEDSGD
jgi:predicted PurR-regulated permease PerM